MKRSAKTLTLLMLLLYTELGICSGASLNDKFASCHTPNCTLHLDREHVVNNTLEVEGWEYFKLTATEQTIIRCNMPNEENTVIRANNNTYVSLENITFIGCSRAKLTVGEENFTSILSINSTTSFCMNSCYFPDYRKVGLTVNNTDRVVLTNSYFRGADDESYKRAILYTTYLYGDVSFYASNLTLDRGNTSYSIELTNYISYNSQENEVGGSLGMFMHNKGLANITISESFFKNSDAILGGGAFFEISRSVSNYTIEVTGSHFENNIANKSKVGKGGAMAVRALANAGIVKIHNSTFRDNKAISGGAIGILLNEVGDTLITLVEIDGSNFRNNSAVLDSGGAIYAENIYISNQNKLTIWNSDFHKNTANSGGAILTMNFQVDVMDNVSISENVAYYGGAMCLLSSSLYFKGANIVLEKNHANHSGGALYLHSTSSLEAKGYETRISNNTAMIRGGGVFVFTKNFENQMRNHWRDKGRLSSYKCFLESSVKNRTTLIFSDNNVTSTTDLCMGDDLFTNTWGSCYNQSNKIPINPSIVFKNRDKNNCKISLDIVKYSRTSHFRSPCQLYYTHSPDNFTKKCSNKLNLDSIPDYNTRLEEAFKNLNVKSGEKVHLFYPGYESQIHIESLDGLNNPIQTLTQVVFKPANESSHQDNNARWISTSGNYNFTINKLSEGNEFIFGQICLISYNTLNEVEHCEYALIGDCPSPLLKAVKGDAGEYCEFDDDKPHTFQKHTFNEVKNSNSKYMIQMTPGTMFYYSKKSEIIFAHCTWFQCKCHRSANGQTCLFNVNAPENQCRDGLKFPKCTECNMPDQSINPPFSWSTGVCSNCSQSEPYRSVVIYIVLTLVITGVIYILPVDVFSNYVRTIVFYSNILYVLSINCGTYVDQYSYDALKIPVVAYNLLVSYMFDFCPPGNRPIYRAIFGMTAPWVFVLYILLIWLAVEKSPCAFIRKLGQYDAINKIWTIIILTYIHLCNQAFSVLSCSENSKGERHWLYDGAENCLENAHLVGSCIAIVNLFLLTTFPLIMMIMSYSRKNKGFVIFEKRYRPGYKKVEMFKLYLRIIFTFFVTLLPYEIPALPCSLITICCLILFVFNSLLKPASDEMANRYESFCLLILAYVGLQSERFDLGKSTLSVIILIPYIIHAVQLLWYFWRWIETKLPKLEEDEKKSEYIRRILRFKPKDK